MSYLAPRLETVSETHVEDQMFWMILGMIVIPIADNKKDPALLLIGIGSFLFGLGILLGG